MLAAPQTVELTFDAGDGIFPGNPASTTATVEIPVNGTLASSQAPVPEREGYALAGWYVGDDPEVALVFSNEADPDQGITATTFASATTLHAIWLEDLSSDDDVSFAGISQAYTGNPVFAAPVFGASFPAEEQDGVAVFYRPAGASDKEWTGDAPVNAGAYDVRFSYPGTDAYARFEKEYRAGIEITPADLNQTGLAAEPSTVAAGTALADINLLGGTVSLASGVEVTGTWRWSDPSAFVNQDGTYQAVFVPTIPEGGSAHNYNPLYVDLMITVKSTDPDQPGGNTDPDDPDVTPEAPDGNPGIPSGNPDDQGGDAGNQGGNVDGSQTETAQGLLVQTGDSQLLIAGVITIVALVAIAVGVMVRRRRQP